MGRRLTASAGLIAIAVAALVATRSSAHAQSSNPLKRGLELYEAGQYAKAAEAFEVAYREKPDSRTLFAWAQATRQSGDCKRAIELYDKVLSAKLPRKQTTAVKKARAECEAQLAAPPPEPAPQQQPEPEPAPPDPSPPPPPSPALELPPPIPSPPRDTAQPESWYSDPLGGALLGLGVVGAGIGVGFYVSARSAQNAADETDNYFEFAEQNDKVEMRRTIAAIGAAAGGAFLIAALLRYTLASDDHDDASAGASLWVNPDTIGLAVGRNF
jgi:tetratricopeptide (TPR) repeat protein